MQPIPIHDAQDSLRELIEAALRGERVTIVDDEGRSVLLTPQQPDHAEARIFGSARGLFTLTDDFDEPLDDFSEYM